MKQADDFLLESQALDALIGPLTEAELTQVTGFKSWTFEAILRHLHFWNRMADLALTAPDEFQQALKPAVDSMMAGSTLPEIELEHFSETGLPLVALWRSGYQSVATAYQQADVSQRVAWVGPSMSARSAITARQMETWAHGQAIADELSVQREEADRIHNIVILGVNTFGWSFTVRGEAVPEAQPFVSLLSPSGERWEFGSPDSDQRISGQAHEFAQVVTQTRNIRDTQLEYEGAIAEHWMHHAQCFAGVASEPPPPGARRIK